MNPIMPLLINISEYVSKNLSEKAVFLYFMILFKSLWLNTNSIIEKTIRDNITPYILNLKYTRKTKQQTICIISAKNAFFIGLLKSPKPCNIPFVTVDNEKNTTAIEPILKTFMSVETLEPLNNVLHIGSASIVIPTKDGITISKTNFIEYLF